MRTILAVYVALCGACGGVSGEAPDPSEAWQGAWTDGAGCAVAITADEGRPPGAVHVRTLAESCHVTYDLDATLDANGDGAVQDGDGIRTGVGHLGRATDGAITATAPNHLVVAVTWSGAGAMTIDLSR